MNALEQLNAYLKRLESRFRLATAARGAALTVSAALIATVLLVLLTSWFAFSERSMTGGRLLLFLVLALVAGFGLVVPLLRAGRAKAVRSTEEKFPEFEERLLTFAEKETDPENNPFLELLAADTVEAAGRAEPHRVVPNRLLAGFLATAAVALLALIWLTMAGPGFLGYGASLLWGGTSRAGNQPFYDVVVSPGDRSVRRGASQAVAARLIGFQSQRVRLCARYKSTTKWEEAVMLPKEGISAYEYLFAGVPETVEYYVDAGRLRSKVYTLSVVDLPRVKRIRVTYHFPSWTGMENAIEDPGGDLRAVEGTEADIEVETDRPLNNGVLVVDGGPEVSLSGKKPKWQTGRLKIEKDGFYYFAVREQGELIRLSDDYFIEARQDGPPVLRIVRPGRDVRVSPIEEVAVAVEAEDDFGLRAMDLRYSVNGGPEQTVPLLKKTGVKKADGATLIYLEDFKLVPGDVIALYATARDARSASRTDMYFLEAQPFEREFMQSQQSGAGGGQGGEQSRISQRQKEIIAATWNQLKNTSRDKKVARENAEFLADVQAKLREQAKSLATRMRRRELSGQNQEFRSFSEDMEKAAEAMGPAVEKLKGMKWRDALPPEQKALQHLLHAEAMFRRIQVAFGSRGGGGGGSMGRDLENLFDLELDTEKNQYETGQQSASAGQRERDIDEALRRLEELARRQQELAERQRRSQQSSQQRWQQEMLRREAEQLQHRIEELIRGESQPSNSQGQQSGQSASSASSGGQQRSLRSMGRQSGRPQTDPRLEQALRRLKEATEDMRRTGQGQAESRRAAERLQEARELIQGLRQQESSKQLGDLAREADKLAGQQRDFEKRLGQLFGNEPPPEPGPSLRRHVTREQYEQSQRLAEEKQRMSEDLARLEREMQRASRDLAGSQRAAASKLRQALGELQQNELALRMRYNTELLRRGLGQYTRAREAPITRGLEDLRDKLAEASAALGQSAAGQKSAEKALAQVEQLRRQVQKMMRGTQGQQQGAGQGRGQGQQQGQGQGQRNQPGQAQGGRGPGEISGGPQRGSDGGPGPVHEFSAMNLGDRQPLVGAGELRRLRQQSLRDLSQLRQAMGDNPEAARDIQALIAEMERLDPSRFPGNPELVTRLRAQVLPTLEQIELRLRRELDEKQGGQVRTGASEPAPAGYADAVAEYFRRLSKQK